MIENFISIRYDETLIRGNRFIHGICELITISIFLSSRLETSKSPYLDVIDKGSLFHEV